MNPDDFITINELHTFRKSEIQGFNSDFWFSNGTSYMILYIIISGTQLQVHKEPCTDSRDETGKNEYPRDQQIKDFHKRWRNKLVIKPELKKEMI